MKYGPISVLSAAGLHATAFEALPLVPSRAGRRPAGHLVSPDQQARRHNVCRMISAWRRFDERNVAAAENVRCYRRKRDVDDAANERTPAASGFRSNH